MEKISWCKQQKSGLKLIRSNIEISQGYLKMAEDSIGTMNREKDKNIVFSVSAGYYAIYYSIYSIMQKIGVKSEIHSCSISFAKEFLNKFYSKDDFRLIEIAFSLRNTLQYYVGRNVNKKELELLWINTYDFFVKSRNILVKLNEKRIEEIRSLLRK